MQSVTDLRGSGQCRADVSGFGLSDGDGVSQKQPVLSAESFGGGKRGDKCFPVLSSIGSALSTAPLHRGVQGKPWGCTPWPSSSLDRPRWEGGGGLGWGPKPAQCPRPPLEGGTKPPFSSSVCFMLSGTLATFVPPTEQWS